MAAQHYLLAGAVGLLAFTAGFIIGQRNPTPPPPAASLRSPPNASLDIEDARPPVSASDLTAKIRELDALGVSGLPGEYVAIIQTLSADEASELLKKTANLRTNPLAEALSAALVSRWGRLCRPKR